MRLILYIFRHIIPIGLLVGVVLIVVSAVTPTGPSRIDGIGVDLLSSPPLTTQAVEEKLNAIQQANADYVRIEVSWTFIEISQDVYNWSNVIPLDQFFTSAQSRGMKSVAVITGFPTYLSSIGLDLDQKTLGERWEKFMQAAVDHFGDQVDYWQIGEEINSNIGSRSLAQADPTYYSKMLVSASKIIKKANSNDEVWMGSLVSATATDCAVNPLTFVLEVNGAKGWSAADAITYQPRRGATTPENPSNVLVNQGCSSSTPDNSNSISAEVQAMQDLARQLGGKPLYITGLFWDQDELIQLQAGRSIDLNTLQSDMMVRGSVMLMGNNSIPLIFWQIDPLNQSASMNSMSNLQAILKDSKSQGQIQGQNGIVHEYRFQKGAEINSLVWRTRDGDLAQAVGFSDLASGEMTAFSVDSPGLDSSLGTMIQVDNSGNTIVMLNERPVLFVGRAGGWDDQIRASVADQLDIWRIDLQGSISGGLNQLKTAFLQWLGGLFNKATTSAIDWGEGKIRDILN